VLDALGGHPRGRGPAGRGRGARSRAGRGTVSRRPATVALCCALLACPGCLHVDYVRERVNEPIPETATEGLAIGAATLDDVIARLGAPTLVWPSENGEVVLAYAWRDDAGWGVSLSYSFDRFANASLEWDWDHAEIPAIVLRLDRELRLRMIQRGLLRDLAPDPSSSDPSVGE